MYSNILIMRHCFFILFLCATWTVQAQYQTISNTKMDATAPHFTQNHLKQPVLSWIERDANGKVVRFAFAVSTDEGKSFGQPIDIPIVPGISGHAEGMPKVAFKADGTIMAAYEVKRPTPESRFAGSIYYRLSSDGGNNWTAPVYVHADTSAGKGRSFMDLHPLPNGEIGISWLGERGADEDSGRPVKFSQTLPGAGLGVEITAKEGACQCCRTNLFADKSGNIHIFFRDILPGGIRDIGHVVSSDGGRSFGSYAVLHHDKWQIDGCPHTGPSTAQMGTTLYTAWYTGSETGQGIKVSDGSGQLRAFIEGSAAQHPQLLSNNDKLILAWDQQQPEEKSTVIVLRTLSANSPKKDHDKTITLAKDAAELPALWATKKGVLVAYEAGPNEKRQIRWEAVEVGQD
jgi:hypothetical protein